MLRMKYYIVICLVKKSSVLREKEKLQCKSNIIIGIGKHSVVFVNAVLLW